MATITKADLLCELRAARAEWDALIARLDEAQLVEPGVAGDWSVKDMVAHLTGYDRWFVQASEAYFRGEMPPLDGSEGMDPEARNQFRHRQTQHLPLAQVLAESQQTFARLLEMVEAHREEFLTQPQYFPDFPEPVHVWELLRGDGYEHYRDHARMVREWLARRGS